MSDYHIDDVKNETKKLALTTYNTALDGIQMAMALVVALAWFSLVKEIIKMKFPNEKMQGVKVFFLFAVAMTVLFAIVATVVPKFPWKAPSRLPIAFAVAASGM